jgi:hypothetical protein
MAGQLVQGQDGLMRTEPLLPVTATKTYQITSPQRAASCEEVDCGHWLNGWKTVVPGEQAEAVRGMVNGLYSFTETRLPDGRAEFIFPPGQECFLGRNGKHTLPWDGRERFFRRDGDWRGNPTGHVTEHTRPDHWVEDFGEHQQQLADRLERG